MTFLRRLIIVALAAGVIVGTGWGLKHVDAINAYFQKDGSGEHAQGADGEHTPKAGETRNEDTATPPAPQDGAATGADAKADDNATTAGDESQHPVGDDGKADDTAHERWPALQFGDAIHAFQIMLPIVAAVVIIDQIRRRRRKSTRIPPTPAASGLPVNG
jgi:hypothetical protein